VSYGNMELFVAATERVKPEGTGGAARTDYHSNCMLSDRAKKRRKTRKELTDVSSIQGDSYMYT